MHWQHTATHENIQETNIIKLKINKHERNELVDIPAEAEVAINDYSYCNPLYTHLPALH